MEHRPIKISKKHKQCRVVIMGAKRDANSVKCAITRTTIQIPWQNAKCLSHKRAAIMPKTAASDIRTTPKMQSPNNVKSLEPLGVEWEWEEGEEGEEEAEEEGEGEEEDHSVEREEWDEEHC